MSSYTATTGWDLIWLPIYFWYGEAARAQYHTLSILGNSRLLEIASLCLLCRVAFVYFVALVYYCAWSLRVVGLCWLTYTEWTSGLLLWPWSAFLLWPWWPCCCSLGQPCCCSLAVVTLVSLAVVALASLAVVALLVALISLAVVALVAWLLASARF
jgi:hypothetical protein